MTPSHARAFPSRDRQGAVNEARLSARAGLWTLLAVVVLATAVFAWSRVGLLDLPGVSRSITVAEAGLANLEQSKQIAAYVEARRMDGVEGEKSSSEWQPPTKIAKPAELIKHGFEALKTSAIAEGLHQMEDGIRLAPDELAFSNSYRMAVFYFRKTFLQEARKRGEITPQFPDYLDKQPVKFFEELVREHPSRETELSLALAWVDNMLLFPALEIKAPSSVQAVEILTGMLNEPGNECYVPALFARGLNHLHRPARLVWPESAKTPPDAAVQDIARCVAIGRKLGVGSKHLQAALAMTLGDAYVKAGRFSLARSWWQIAQNLCHDNDIERAIMRRYSWRDEEMIDRLEEELDRSRSELDHPMTDLALMWN